MCIRYSAQIRLRVVQPESINTQIVVIPFANFPDVFPGFRIESVNLYAVPLIVVGLESAALRAHKQTALQHGVEVLAPAVH